MKLSLGLLAEVIQSSVNIEILKHLQNLISTIISKEISTKYLSKNRQNEIRDKRSNSCTFYPI